ncbi:MAG TPA: iron-sulfur cluster repair di-iron protein [Candidatus Obscuribacterales bacterium]
MSSATKSICTVCNYVYDESEHIQGSPTQKFKQLNDAWRCPDCGAEKEMFQPCSCIEWPSQGSSCRSDSSAEQELDEQVKIYAHRTVGELVAEHPLRAGVFEKYKIDFCCGGKVPVEEACRKKVLPLKQVVAELMAADSKELPPDEDWTKQSLTKLIAHIVHKYHEPLRQQLPSIHQLAEKVARVHGHNHKEMVKVLHIFTRFKAQLEQHMQKEELILFPAISAMENGGGAAAFGCGGGIEMPINVMTQEHDDAGDALMAMRKLTNDYTPPADACNSFKVLLFSLSSLESEMHHHVHKENSILFPRAVELAGAPAAAAP